MSFSDHWAPTPARYKSGGLFEPELTFEYMGAFNASNLNEVLRRRTVFDPECAQNLTLAAS